MIPECLQITTVASRTEPGVLRVQLSGDVGDVDDASAPALHDALSGIIADQVTSLRLELDLTHVRHFSSSAVIVLLSVKQSVNDALIVVAANRAVTRVLEVLHLERLLGAATATGVVG